MSSDLYLFLTITGGVCCLLCITFVIGIVFFYIKEAILEYLYKKTYKNRFKKKPIAACYCVDCRKWNQETGECSDHCNSRIMASCWFCCFAEPMTRKESEMIINKEKSDEKETIY